MPIIYDLESGEPYEVSQKEYEESLKLWGACKPKIGFEDIKGNIIVVGTSSKVEKTRNEKYSASHVFIDFSKNNNVGVKGYWFYPEEARLYNLYQTDRPKFLEELKKLKDKQDNE